MKKLFFTASLIFFTVMGFAQNSNANLSKGVYLLDTAKTAVGYVAAAKYFKALANADQQNWLTYYYAAYSQLMLGIRSSEDQETKDDIYDEALNYIAKADALSADNSEIHVLKAYITFMKMSVYPQKRAMTLIPESNKLIEKAIALDPQNPRAYLIKGQNSFYTPEMFGGGKQVAKATLKQAFEKAKNNAPYPNWGAQRTEDLLKDMK